MRRIYLETVKKYATKQNLAGGTVVGLILWFLLTTGSIDILDYSGDSYCAGTPGDPCYAYINFTALEDIYIYPINYDPWGRDTPFNFEPNVKSWKLQRSWGKYWRTIDLTKPWSSVVKYAVKFSKGVTYQIRIVAYKNNPEDTIKWGAFDIDPYFLGVAFEKEENCVQEIIGSKGGKCSDVFNETDSKTYKVCSRENIYKTTCKDTGKINYNGDLIGYDGFVCSTKNATTMTCDSKEDGNGDGICQSGETCVEYNVKDKKEKVLDNSAKLKVIYIES